LTCGAVRVRAGANRRVGDFVCGLTLRRGATLCGRTRVVDGGLTDVAERDDVGRERTAGGGDVRAVEPERTVGVVAGLVERGVVAGGAERGVGVGGVAGSTRGVVERAWGVTARGWRTCRSRARCCSNRLERSWVALRDGGGVATVVDRYGVRSSSSREIERR
jgi:hypothetical protein